MHTSAHWNYVDPLHNNVKSLPIHVSFNVKLWRKSEWIAHSVQAARVGGQIQERAEVFRTRSDRFWVPPNFLYHEYSAFLGDVWILYG